MSDPTIDELTNPLSSSDVKATIYSELAAVGVDTTSWKPGAVVRTMIAAFCTLFAAFTVWSSKAVRAGFLLLGSDPAWLRSAAKYDYGTNFFPATFATGPLTITNSGVGTYSWNPGELSVVATLLIRGVSTVKSYTNADPISLGASSSVTVAIIADEIGADSTAPIGSINKLSPPISGLSVSNAAAVVGADDEAPQALINRALAQASAVSPNGPRDAYRAVLEAATRADGSQIANRIKVVPGNPVIVIAGTDSGTISSGDLAILDATMQTSVVPIGVAATIAAATSRVQTASISVSMYDSTETDAEVKARIVSAVIAAIANLPIGGDPPYTAGAGTLYLELFRTAAKSASVNIFNAVVTSPGGDVSLLATDSVSTGTITISIVRFASV